MAGAEAFTILAVLEARDRASAVFERIDATMNKFATSAKRAAAAASGAGALIDESLLQTASGADAVKVASARVAAAQARVAVTAREQAVAEQELIAAQQASAAAGSGDAAAQDRLAAAGERLAVTQKEAAAAAMKLRDAEALQADTAAAAGLKTDESALAQSRFGSAMSKGGEAMAGASKLAVGAGIAVAAIGYESVKAATSFQNLTTQLVTTAGEAPSALKQVQQGIIDISNQTATSADDLAKSMYIVEAAGYHAATGGLDVLKAATEGARLENSDFKTVANGVTDILKDYHLSASESANVTSQLVSAVGHGKANFQQFSAALSNIIPLGAAVHLQFSDLSGVLAEMTSHGVTAQRASQNMADALRHLEGPTAAMQKEFKAVGISAEDVQQHLSQQGLGGTLEWLSEVAHDNASRLGQTYPAALKALMGTAAGLNVALMTTGDNSKETAQAIKEIGSASADARGNVQGFSNVQHTLGFQVSQAKQTIHNMGIEIGTALLPMVTKALEAINKVLVPLMNWISAHQKLVASIFEVVGAIIGLVLALKGISTAVQMVSMAFRLIAANPIVAAIILIVIALIYAYYHFKAFRDVVDEVANFLKGIFIAAWNEVSGVVSKFAKIVLPEVKAAMKEVSEWIKARLDELHAWWSDHSKQVHEVWSALFETLKTIVKVWWDGYLKPLLSIIKSVWITDWTAIKDAVKLIWETISHLISTDLHLIENTISLVLDIITGKWGRVWGDLKRLVSQALHDVVSTIIAIGSGFGTLLYDAGANIIRGLINGIRSMIGGVTSAIGDVASAIRAHLPFSPAKVGPLSGSGDPKIGGRKIGQQIAAGLVASVPDVAAAAVSIAGAAGSALTIAKAELGISSPSTKFRALGAWVVHGLVDGLTGSSASVKSAVNRLARSLYIDFGSAHHSLQTYVNREGTLLERLASRRDSVAARLKAAQKDLASVQADWVKERDSISADIMKQASIVMQPSSPYISLTGQDILQNMQQQVSDAAAFAQELKNAQRKGLSADLVQEIAAAGVAQGGATALALSNASQGVIRQVNDLQRQMSRAADSTGGAVADAMYGAGLRSAEGLVKGLQSQEGAIERQMMRIAKSMQSAVKRALGIRSPSTVFADEVGQWIPPGIARGIEGSSSVVHRTLEGLAAQIVARARKAVSPASLAPAAGTPGFLPAGGYGPTAAGAAGTTVVFDLRQSHIMSDRDMDVLVSKIGRQLATRVLPAGGTRIRM